MTVPHQGGPEGPTMTVHLRAVDADSLLAALEWAVNHPDLEMGPGLHVAGAVEAGRRIEAVADLHRRGVSDFAVIGVVPQLRRPRWFWRPIVAWQFRRQRNEP